MTGAAAEIAGPAVGRDERPVVGAGLQRQLQHAELSDADLQRGIGAIEVAARYEESTYGGRDLSEPPSRSPRSAKVAGTTDRAWTIGVNWYVNRWVKAQVNGIHEAIEDPTLAPVPGKPVFWSGVCRLQFAM